jgi:phage terminase large subunit
MVTTMLIPPQTQTNLRRYAEAAKAAGVRRDQVERFMGAGYVAQPHQLAFHAAARDCDRSTGPEMIGFGGARGPGKTHGALAQVGLDDCQRYPGLKILFLRKVAKSAKESFEDLRRKLFSSMPHDYRRQEGVLEFANGSRIVLGHFKDERDIDQYLGIEYDGVAIEEATTLTRSKVTAIGGSIRTSKLGWRPRQYLTTNPGNIGHQWFRSEFVLPHRKGAQGLTRFIPATARQNKYLNPEYRRYLARLTGTLGRMWRDGDWDVAGGAYFTTWNYDTHVVPTVELLPHWSTWLAMDYGFTHFTVIHLVARDDDGKVHFVDEHAERRWLIPQHNEALKAMLERNKVNKERITRFVAGHDVFSVKSDGATIADAWAKFGWYLDMANNDRINGAAQWLGYLGNPAQDLPAQVAISESCPRLIETMPMLLSDPRRPEDVLKVDCDEDGEGGDDPYDCARYGLMEAGNPSAAIVDYYLRQAAAKAKNKGVAHA